MKKEFKDLDDMVLISVISYIILAVVVVIIDITNCYITLICITIPFLIYLISIISNYSHIILEQQKLMDERDAEFDIILKQLQEYNDYTKNKNNEK